MKLTNKDKKELEQRAKKASESLNFLEKASPIEIYHHLRDNKIAFNRNFNEQTKKVVDKLLNHKNKIVKLAVAEFYNDDEVTEDIFFKSKDKDIRIACLKKDFTFPLFIGLGFFGSKTQEAIFNKFIKQANDKELYAYFTNKYFRLSYISSLLEKESAFKKISKKKYEKIILILEHNPNLQKKPDLNNYSAEDGYGWYSDDRTYEKFHKELNILKKLRSL